MSKRTEGLVSHVAKFVDNRYNFEFRFIVPIKDVKLSKGNFIMNIQEIGLKGTDTVYFDLVIPDKEYNNQRISKFLTINRDEEKFTLILKCSLYAPDEEFKRKIVDSALGVKYSFKLIHLTQEHTKYKEDLHQRHFITGEKQRYVAYKNSNVAKPYQGGDFTGGR